MGTNVHGCFKLSLSARTFQGFAFARIEEHPSGVKHHGAQREKSHIPLQPLIPGDGFVDMMDSEQVVIDDAFDQVEDAESHQDGYGEPLAGPPHVIAVCRSPKNDQANEHEEVG